MISYSVTQHIGEIGIRIALGLLRGPCSPVQMDVMSNEICCGGDGIGIGMIASIVVANLIATLLFGTDPTDPPTFGGMICRWEVTLLAGIFERGVQRGPISWLRWGMSRGKECRLDVKLQPAVFPVRHYAAAWKFTSLEMELSSLSAAFSSPRIESRTWAWSERSRRFAQLRSVP